MVGEGRAPTTEEVMATSVKKKKKRRRMKCMVKCIIETKPREGYSFPFYTFNAAMRQENFPKCVPAWCRGGESIKSSPLYAIECMGSGHADK